VIGTGAVVLHPSLRTSEGTIAGTTTPDPNTALEIAATKVEFDRLD
jgi:hypothetical protein